LKKNKLILMTVLIALVVMGFSYYDGVKPWVAPKSADAIKNPLKGSSSATAEGKKLYNQMCAICHGNKGKGDGIGGAALNPKPANYSSDKIQAQTDGAIYWKLTEGRAPMAGYKEILKDNQRWQLVNYIRTFKKNKSKAKANDEKIEKVESHEEKAARLEKEANEKYNKLITEADKFFEDKDYKAAKIKYNEAFTIKNTEPEFKLRLEEIEDLIAEVEKKEILKQEIKKELKDELIEELKKIIVIELDKQQK
jgi:mono/diheme cytochrome c family protein